jgi:nucleotide-binding universal stress UspA family protein
MDADKCLLIAIDASEASDRAVAYVARMMQGQPGLRVLLCHVSSPMPPELLEFGGRENPGAEERTEAVLHGTQAAWLEQAKQAAQPVFARAQTRLRQAAIPESAVETRMATPVSGEALDTTILEAARQARCDTIVVGRTAFPWWQELVRSHLADTLLQQAKGCTLWIVQ